MEMMDMLAAMLSDDGDEMDAQDFAKLLHGKRSDSGETENSMAFHMMYKRGFNSSDYDDLFEAVAGGGMHHGDIDLFKGEDVQRLAKEFKPMSNILLETKLLAERQKVSRMLRDMIAMHSLVKALSDKLDEADKRIEALEPFEDGFDMMERRLKTTKHLNEFLSDNLDEQAEKAELLRDTVVELVDQFGKSGKRADLVEHLVAAVATFDFPPEDNADEDIEPEGMAEGQQDVVGA